LTGEKHTNVNTVYRHRSPQKWTKELRKPVCF
jgi:hypothetical protein